MQKKTDEQNEARRLYQEGRPYGEIMRLLGVSKGSVSLWCGDLAAEKRAASRVIREARETVRKKDISQRTAIREANRVGVPAEAPYDNHLLYIYPGADNVTRVQLVNRTTRKHTVLSMARYRMSVHLGRILKKNELVMHRKELDNDDLSNLVLSKVGEQRTWRQLPEKECVMCETMFVPSRKSIETCSKACKYLLISYRLMERNQ